MEPLWPGQPRHFSSPQQSHIPLDRLENCSAFFFPNVKLILMTHYLLHIEAQLGSHG